MCHGAKGPEVVENIRLAVMVAPVAAAPSVAARARHVISPSNALRPMVQRAVRGSRARYQELSKNAFTAANGSTASRMSLDCQPRLVCLTPHRNRWPPMSAARAGVRMRLSIDSLDRLCPAHASDLQSGRQAGKMGMRFFSMGFGRARALLTIIGAALAILASGCGDNYRTPIYPITGSGPAQQPSSYAVVVSAPSPTAAGILTMIDYSGDTILNETPIGPGPRMFTLDAFGNNGYTINSDGTLSDFTISTSLQAKKCSHFHAACCRTGGQSHLAGRGPVGGRPERRRR